ncbi:MAG: methyl-accepting chemotaxis protein [Lentisphaerota bacterium]
MFGLFTKTLRRRLIFLMVAATIIPIIVISFFAIKYSSDSLYTLQETAIKDDLAVLSEAMLHEKLVPRAKDMKQIIIDNEHIMKLADIINIETKAITQAKVSTATDAKSAPVDVKEDIVDIKAVTAELDKLLESRIKTSGFTNIFIVNNNGKIIYDMTHKDRTGKEMSNIDAPILKAAIDETFKANLPTYSDFEISAFSYSKPEMYLAYPDPDEKGQKDLLFIGSLAGSWLADSIDSFSTLARTKGVEVHIVGSDGKIRSSKNRDASSTKALGTSIKSELIDNIIKEKRWSGLTVDEEGVDVVGATDPFDTSSIKDIDFNFNWGISMEVPAQTVFAPVYKLVKDIIIVAVILVILFALVAFFFANSISRPVSALARYANQVAGGDLNVVIAIKARKDEVGSLTTSFASMIESLKSQTLQMSSASSQLSSSMQEIAATVTQLSSSVTETTAAVNEITSTIEEVRQVSTLAHKKAEDMAGKADSVRTVADEGKTASERVSNGISEINKQVESIASTTIKLGEQTKNISEIIDSVTDIADQSNLLSVNASIEAAKAGEYGKGFSVVAREIKSLAEKSKDSTKQIKEILTDIQKSASSAIMATEKGTKTVSEGLELSKTSKVAIENLESSVNEAVGTATQIVSSSKEQLSGMNQLFETVGSIKQAMQQNSESIRQLEKEAKNLAQLASNLKELAGKFTVK